MSAGLAQRIAAFLDAHHVMSLATAGDKNPHAANVFYARDGLGLVWVSDPASQHSCDLQVRPQAAATIAPDYADFPEIQGLQVRGMAHRVADPGEQAHLLGLLKARYPFLAKLDTAPPDLKAAWARAALYRLDPQRIVMIDNTRGFGHKETLEIGGVTD
jgi:hypothetical protein